VAKILVADDNSNVQKTVALALAHMGVDVVSVNNGEAAVRKLSDFLPDLVLADIFMPVRNGYEVCEYVKKDSRFSRIPVVLLVGAFDPLDEREAQRVGADGILKKPFVPPDPLIMMVKTLLDRTVGERLVAVSVSEPAAAVQAGANGSAITEAHVPEPQIHEESSSQEFPLPVANVDFGKGDRPIAFGQLLETDAQEEVPQVSAPIEPVDNEQILTSSRDQTLGDPIFWRNDSHQAEPEAIQPEEEPASSPEIPVWRKAEDSALRRDEAVLSAPIEPLELEPLELVRDEPDESSPSVVDTDAVLLDPAAQAPLNVEPEKPEDLAANPIEWMATAPHEPSDEGHEPTPGWDEPIPESTHTIDRIESSDQPLIPVNTPANISAPVVAQVPEPVPTPILAQSQAPDANKIAVLISTKTDAPATPAAITPKAHIALSPEAQSAGDTARSIPRQEWDDLAASLRPKADEPASPQIKSESGSGPSTQVPKTSAENTEPAAAGESQEISPNPALVEAVVQRVLDKMRPQVVDIITKEFLRPIVQALVHREIEKH
jgi:CheY-like chemotaxis protein